MLRVPRVLLERPVLKVLLDRLAPPEPMGQPDQPAPPELRALLAQVSKVPPALQVPKGLPVPPGWACRVRPVPRDLLVLLAF